MTTLRAAKLHLVQSDLMAIGETLREHELLDLELRAVQLAHDVGAAARDDEPTRDLPLPPKE